MSNMGNLIDQMETEMFKQFRTTPEQRAEEERLRQIQRDWEAQHTAIETEQEEDDDIQVYKNPWVGLTEEEVVAAKMVGRDLEFVSMTALRRFAKDIEAKLKEKNIGGRR